MAPTIENGWVCAECGNTNFDDRTHCNMKKCGAPKPAPGAKLPNWICSACGNTNFGDRRVCNMRKCGAPRSSGPTMRPTDKAVASGMPGMLFGAIQAWPMMTTPSVLGVGGYNAAGRRILVKVGPYTKQSSSASKTDPAERAAKDGDWICEECQNMNYADRGFCNMRKCGAPRPIGDWTCAACGNMNYSDRVNCNMRKCGAPRTDVDPRAVMELVAKGKGRGNWHGLALP